jgi:anti-sigma regulatory factor (Ser/Thr protein kinase)
MLRTIELPRDELAPSRARHAVASACADNGSRLTSEARLLVSELVTNSVVHGEGDAIRLVVDLDHRGRLRCEVIDAGDGFVPVARAADRTESGGWGLELVERLSDRWGVREGSTHVWFELSVEPAAASA